MSLDAAQKAPVDVEADILLLSVLCDWDALAVGFELVLYNLAVGIVLHAEGVVQHTGDVIFPERGARRQSAASVPASSNTRNLFQCLSIDDP